MTPRRSCGRRAIASRRVAGPGSRRAAGRRGPVSAEYLAERARRAGSATCDVPSAYRNLELFERLGMVRHVHIGHGPGLYALVSRGRACLRGLRALRAARPPGGRAGRGGPTSDPQGSRVRGSFQPLPDPRSVPRLRRRRDRLTGTLPRAQPRRPRSLTRGLKTTGRNQRKLPPGGTTQRRSARASSASSPSSPTLAAPSRRIASARPSQTAATAATRWVGPNPAAPRSSRRSRLDLGHGHLREGLVGLTVVDLLGQHPVEPLASAAVAGGPAHPVSASANAPIAA